MGLTAFESILLTCAIVGSVHLLVTVLTSLERDEEDHRDIMSHLAKYKFLHENTITIQDTKIPFYH